MCLLVVQHNLKNSKKSELIPKEMFEVVWENNPHGFGIGWFKDGKPHVEHSMKMADAWELYQNNWKDFSGEMIVHWRWSTGGNKDETNCHPFITSTPNPAILGHNGVISPTPGCPDDWSDTRWFASSLSELLKHPDEFSHKDDEDTMKKYLGASRLAIIDHDGKLHTWNFPTQSPDNVKYGLFSLAGGTRKRTVATTYNNWSTGCAYTPHNHHAKTYQARKTNYDPLPYIDPKLVEKEAFSLPHTFFLFEILETGTYMDYEMLMRRFYNRFGRFPTCQETMGAFALSSNNRKLKPVKEKKQKEVLFNHGL